MGDMIVEVITYLTPVLGIATITSPEQQDFLRSAMRSGRRAILAEAMECRIEFMECDSCRSKPGSPTLCAGCLHNREVIELLKKQRSF